MGAVRSMVSVAAAVGVAWLGGQILGEYRFEGFVPIAGGAALGVAVCAAANLAWRGRDVPLLLGGVAATAAGAGEALAVEIDTSDLRPWTWEGYAAVAAASSAAIAWSWARRRSARLSNR